MHEEIKAHGIDGLPEEPSLQQDLERQNKIDRLNEIRKNVDEIVDLLGHPIEEGIKPTVVILNALGLRTTQSCEGEMDRWMAGPFVDIGPELPAGNEWKRDKEQLPLVRHEILLMRAKLNIFLNMFYSQHKADYDTTLQHIELGHDFRLQSNASELIAVLPPEQQKEALQKYQEEMRVFTEFLIKYYLES
mgnify:CR=1 FL=1